MIYVMGDTHGQPTNFHNFKKRCQNEYSKLTKDDTLIILGDFGFIWSQDFESKEERYWLNWINDKPYTTVFVCGNHENFDRLYQYPVKEWNGGKVHEIRPNVFHLLRGEVFTIEGKKFFAFGGASSHDISDGILDPNEAGYENKLKRWSRERRIFRVKGLSWWERELPSQEEMENGIRNLEANNWEVDYVLTHCLPQSVAAMGGWFGSDVLTNYFDELTTDKGLKFKGWYCGHYHEDNNFLGKFHIRYRESEEVR